MNELIVKTEEGTLTLAPSVEKLIDEIEDLKNDATQTELEMRETILKAMQDAGITSAKVGKHTISQVIPKGTVTFDYEAFRKENDQIAAAYSTTTETEFFDIEALKKAHPELVKEFTRVNKVSVLDTKKLAKSLPDIYNKYATEVKSDKAITLKIVTKSPEAK